MTTETEALQNPWNEICTHIDSNTESVYGPNKRTIG